MSPEQSAKLLRIHIAEADRHQGKPLYEALVDKCRELKIAIVDTAENIARFASAAEEMMDSGVMAISEVQARRVQKKAD